MRKILTSERLFSLTLAQGLFYITGNFVEIPCYIKNPPGGSHCGGAEPCRWSDPPQARECAWAHSLFTWQIRQSNFTHKISIEGWRGFQHFQIARHQKKTVNCIGVTLDLRINYTSVNEGSERLPVDQRGQAADFLIGFGKYLTNNIIVARGYPKWSCFACITKIIDHRP